MQLGDNFLFLAYKLNLLKKGLLLIYHWVVLMLPLLRQGKLSTHSGVECRYLQCFAASSAAAKTRGIGSRESEKEANILRQRRRPYKNTRKPNIYLSKATRHRHTYVWANNSMGVQLTLDTSILKYTRKMALLVGVVNIWLTCTRTFWQC